jgi:hypothetical protein
LIPELDEFKPELTNDRSLNEPEITAVQFYLDTIKGLSQLRVGYYSRQIGQIERALGKRLGSKKALQEFTYRYDNESLNDLVLNRNSTVNYVEKEGRLIRKYRPAYMKPTSRWGRAQLYAPNKQLGNLEIDTIWFNMIVLWVYTFALYLALRWDLLRKLIILFSNRKLRRKRSSSTQG